MDDQQKIPDAEQPVSIVAASIPGPLTIHFPLAVFEPSGTLEHRLHRSQFLKEMMNLYDRFAEEARKKLNERDPLVVRPPLPKLPMFVLDTSAMNVLSNDNRDSEPTTKE